MERALQRVCPPRKSPLLWLMGPRPWGPHPIHLQGERGKEEDVCKVTTETARTQAHEWVRRMALSLWTWSLGVVYKELQGAALSGQEQQDGVQAEPGVHRPAL